jgi:hypothetical protein
MTSTVPTVPSCRANIGRLGAQTYPDLYVAIGVHSGLARGAASDMPSAFVAMRGGGAVGTSTSRSPAQRRVVPAIIFHGDRDTTVNPCNADAVAAHSAQGAALGTHAEDGQVPGGHAFGRTLRADADGDRAVGGARRGSRLVRR